MAHKSGFVNIIGNPNAGKSTLMNALVGEKLSIITSKAQTTRHRIMGIVNGEDFQIVYSDTPGILKPNYALQEQMMKFVHSALQDADIVLYVVEMGEKNPPQEVIDKLQPGNIPMILVLNKIDLGDEETVKNQLDHWGGLFPKAHILPVSALHKFNLERVFDLIIENLPEFPAYYPKDELTDKNMRFFVQEIIREKILIHYKKEIPYSVEVVVEEYKEEGKLTRIRATIFTERDSQKIILIGNKGQAIKRVGTEARKDIEEFIDTKVYLELFVKVRKDWREKDNELKNFGYQ